MSEYNIARRGLLLGTGGLLVGAAANAFEQRLGLSVPSDRVVEPVSFEVFSEANTTPEAIPPHLSFLNYAARTDYSDPHFNSLLKRLLDESSHRLLIDCVNHHPKYEKRYKSTDPLRISDHFYWNAVDIGMVDGEPVKPGSEKARAYVEALLALPRSDKRRPTRIISPWGDITETNQDHKTHIHIANSRR